MKWYFVFIKSAREQIRDYWILILTLTFAPLFVFLYYLMSEVEETVYEVLFLNRDRTVQFSGEDVNLGDTLVYYLQEYAGSQEDIYIEFKKARDRESGIKLLKEGDAHAMVVLPDNLSQSILGSGAMDEEIVLELVGDITDVNYIVGAVWTEELINRFVMEASGIGLPFTWKETTLGYSGRRSYFELYVPGLMIFSIIMMMFTASATIVREPEAGTLERLKISKLPALSYLAGISLVQVIVGIISLLLTIVVAVLLGYEIFPGTLGYIFLIGMLTSLSMISFSLIVSAICRSVKDVAVIGTFPLLIMMFFTGAAFPLGGGRLFTLGDHTFYMNDILSPTWAVEALNKVLIRGVPAMDTYPEVMALIILTVVYFFIGVWAFRRRHMRAA